MSAATAAGKAAAAAPPSQPPEQPTAKPLINLLRGWPAPSTLPAVQLREAADRVLTDAALAVPSLQYGPDPGYQPLREELAALLSAVFRDHGAPHDPERICITGGASQNMACILQSFTDPAYTAYIWVSAPCYYLMCPIFEDAGFAGRLRAVPEDDEGIDVEALERGFRSALPSSSPSSSSSSSSSSLKPHLPPWRKAYRHVVYVVPASSNPSGRTMTLARRRALVQLARRYDALVVADDVYDFLQWTVDEGDGDGNNNDDDSLQRPPRDSNPGVSLPPPLPRLVDIDRMLTGTGPPSSPFGHAVSNGSFSKIVGPGIRTGWVEATPAFVFGLAQTGSTKSGGAPSQLSAAIVAEMMRTGALNRHLQHVARPTLQRRHRLMTRAIKTHLTPFVDILQSAPPVPAAASAEAAEAATSTSTATPPTYGGYFLWLRLRRDDVLAAAVASRAQTDENLVVATGGMFEVKGDEAAARFDHHLRLCYAWEDEARLVEGVERLARVLRNWDQPRHEHAQKQPENNDGDAGVEEYK
ncbi:aminotransferase, class i/classii [Niveomyces insectorum RCEF 264]|uniref:Aminotransferase, class i/classii n=1 Tax=Niveomyces insectorum RCEF 264 TaxID=1081102 RepID=A0A162JFV6_9HYPO|nr:aminotransferase, class i/classii [Niveomyces insectorum RCEF 264]